jgi:hypothetical protein
MNEKNNHKIFFIKKYFYCWTRETHTKSHARVEEFFFEEKIEKSYGNEFFTLSHTQTRESYKSHRHQVR